MADVRPFRALRFDADRVDPATVIAPPYDVISPSQQAELYGRSPYNIIRVEYGQQQDGDSSADNRYTRAAADLAAWRQAGILTRPDAPTFYVYDLRFEWEGKTYFRQHVFGLVRLEEWDKGVVKPHEHTLSGPKQDRLELLRTTRTQVSPVYCLYRRRNTPAVSLATDSVLYEVDVDDQHHTLSTAAGDPEIQKIREMLANSDFYIADGHHRYETALAYRNECRAAAPNWTGEEPENFVLMAMTEASDPGLLVLPTHRLVRVPIPLDSIAKLERIFDVSRLDRTLDLDSGLARMAVDARSDMTALIVYGLEPGAAHLVRLRDRVGVERLMPEGESTAWKRLDVNVLQYGILDALFGIDDDRLRAGGAVSYVQDPEAAMASIDAGSATCAFLLNATPVDQLLAVSDADGRMPQKSTYFYPKLPTGLVLNGFD